MSAKGRWGDFMPVCFSLWIFAAPFHELWSASLGNSLD